MIFIKKYNKNPLVYGILENHLWVYHKEFEHAYEYNFYKERADKKLKTFVKSIPRCPICNGYLSTKSTSVDHIQRKRDGGNNSIDNGQLTHIYCNTTYKN